jgi:hypothetical protein
MGIPLPVYKQQQHDCDGVHGEKYRNHKNHIELVPSLYVVEGLIRLKNALSQHEAR